MNPTSMRMLIICPDTMDAIFVHPQFLFLIILCGYSAEDDIATCEKVIDDSSLFGGPGFPSDFAAIQFNVWDALGFS